MEAAEVAVLLFSSQPSAFVSFPDREACSLSTTGQPRHSAQSEGHIGDFSPIDRLNAVDIILQIFVCWGTGLTVKADVPAGMWRRMRAATVQIRCELHFFFFFAI